MKKLISMTLVAAMALTMGACSAKKETTSSVNATTEAVTSEATTNTDASVTEASAEQSNKSAENTEPAKYGVLTMLNMTEEEMGQYRGSWRFVSEILEKEGYWERKTELARGKKEIVYYDTLDSMLMALNSGDIEQMMVYYRTGQYLCAANDNLQLVHTINLEKERNTFAKLLLSGHLGNDFSFLMMEGNEALRDEFSNAINSMKTDGTMDKLIQEQIDAPINGKEVESIAMPEIEGAETIKVAVTGALPPMDYVAADGTPAGFNTAVLAEISQRIGKNIDLVVDSIGRATALSSGTVDAVFWTRTNEMAAHYAEMSEEERAADIKKYEAEMNDEEIEAFKKVSEAFDFENYDKVDMPESTICTVPYYSDLIVPVTRK